MAYFTNSQGYLFLCSDYMAAAGIENYIKPQTWQKMICGEWMELYHFDENKNLICLNGKIASKCQLEIREILLVNSLSGFVYELYRKISSPGNTEHINCSGDLLYARASRIRAADGHFPDFLFLIRNIFKGK